MKSKSLSDEQLRCLSKLEGISPYPIVAFSDQNLTTRSFQLQHQHDRADAKEWLRKRGLLASLPQYDPQSEGVDEFAKRIERFCGIEPGSVLTMHKLGILTFKPEWAESQLHGKRKLSEHSFWCLINSLSASNLEEHGIRFGFIGNEAYSDKAPQK